MMHGQRNIKLHFMCTVTDPVAKTETHFMRRVTGYINTKRD